MEESRFEADHPYPPAFKLIVSCPSGLSPSQLSVVFDPEYDRIHHSDTSLENSISEIWDRRVQQNPSLYNGLKFRYGGNISGGADSSQEHGVCLHLGLTDYRTFVGTNLNPLWERFLFPSEDDWRRCQHTSNPLGNGAIVETAEKDIVVLQRSANVGEFPGHFVFPGGHPEPQEVGITSHHCKFELSHQMVNDMVSREMFDSIIREVVEEIGVAADTLENPVFIGVSQRVLNVRPTAFFFIKCSLQSKEIQHLYYNAQDRFESTQLCTMSMVMIDFLSTLRLRSSLDSLKNNLLTTCCLPLTRKKIYICPYLCYSMNHLIKTIYKRRQVNRPPVSSIRKVSLCTGSQRRRTI